MHYSLQKRRRIERTAAAPHFCLGRITTRVALPLSVILTISRTDVHHSSLFIYPALERSHWRLIPPRSFTQIEFCPGSKVSFSSPTLLSVRLLRASVRQSVTLYCSWWGQRRNRRSWTQTQSGNLVSPARFTLVTVKHTAYATIRLFV